MKSGIIIGLCLFSQAVFAEGLPVITAQPTNQIAAPGDTAALTVTATEAASFQWRFNGADIFGATNATLQIPNAQATNAGYCLVVAKNATGWGAEPDGLAFGGSQCRIPFFCRRCGAVFK